MQVSQGNRDTVTGVFQLSAKVSSIHAGTGSVLHSSDTCKPAVASCEHSDPASDWRDSFSPSTESLGPQSSWEIFVSASDCSSLTQLELTSSLPSDKRRKKSHLFLCARYSAKFFTCIKLFNPPNNQWDKLLSLLSLSVFYKWGNWEERHLVTCSKLPSL